MTDAGKIGRVYSDGEVIIRQGETGECMYVVQEGTVEVLEDAGGRPTLLGEMGPGDFFGEMALVDRDVRSATVRARGAARVLTVDKRTFLRRVHEDPSLAYRIMEKMSRRIRDLDTEVARLRVITGERS